jgi:hypothetical protein
MATAADGDVPDGQWKDALASRFDRDAYIFSVTTAAADDATIIADFNAALNKSRFNFFYRNCSNQTKDIFDLILPNTIGDRTSGMTMQTPKGLVKALVRRALEQPELQLRVRRYGQIPGTFNRSRDVLFPMENTFRNIVLAPFWFFGGYREVALGAAFYHEVISEFDISDAYLDFISPRAATLTLEQHRLRRQQDQVRTRLTAAQNRGSGWATLGTLNASISRRLGDIRRDKREEVIAVVGSQAEWGALQGEFQVLIEELRDRLALREALRRPLEETVASGQLAERLLQAFETDGAFYVDREGPWLSLPLTDGEWSSIGLSTSQILCGDPRLAALVLAAAIDFNLHQASHARERFEYVDGLLVLLRTAMDRIDVAGD